MSRKRRTPSLSPPPSVERHVAGELWVVATPIGNLEDITHRGVRLLKEADLIAAEDTREAAKLLGRFGIQTPVTSLHEHNERERIPELIRLMKEEGRRVALISDAGAPAVSDPGADLAQTAAAQGIRVTPIPGANAAVTLLMAAGFSASAFLFAGYPPPKTHARREFFEGLKEIPHPLVFLEAPHRIAASLEDLTAVLGDRPAVLGREMTKIHETFYRGRISEIALALGPEVRGEITLVVEGAPPRRAAPEEEVIGRLKEALDAESHPPLAQLASAIARETGWPKKEIYRLGLKMKS